MTGFGLAENTNRGLRFHYNNLDNWDFLTLLRENRFNVSFTGGNEITVNSELQFASFFEPHFKEAKYKCLLTPEDSVLMPQGGYYLTNAFLKNWKPIAYDKFGKTVSVFFSPENGLGGWIFVFPQIKDKSNFLLEFLRDILPKVIPPLFPYSLNRDWINRAEYQPVTVQNLKNQIEEIELEAKRKIEKINEEIKKEKQQIEFQNKLLTDDGDSLVTAVEKTLKVLGFQNVINVDEQYQAEGKVGNDEDLQIRDEPVNILVEIKGVSGIPKDSDVLQVLKHVPIRMKEWQDFDVKALSIINHQKAIPPLERNNSKVFRDLILKSAIEQNLGLLTTFDLYRLVRSYLKNNWTPENIKDLFTQSGHITIVPNHYQYVGVIENFWEKVSAVGIRIEEIPIRLGDKIAFEFPIEFEEISVNSLQVENNSTEIAEVGNLAGIKTNLTKELLRKGIRVFKVK